MSKLLKNVAAQESANLELENNASKEAANCQLASSFMDGMSREIKGYIYIYMYG